eukprot:CAMPEP_0174379674 /NCGR_PEP_ID=MMETSP0811_2-20130205/122867_1 /TAXON_ID=73025 ORGANISM="Eutreptiella gymnastica-like, Strain CCMP1594" /NCGR_SAMPLE_ID=MMETSP0811_2 /ASSEMBLY_ACC=CAM_ASM_000667 /LENGTH=52 /DNA_ID=CAMNT_0015532287 /DNA_START=1675 /DNA_END=1831 /DNA_ORIENTATION=-
MAACIFWEWDMYWPSGMPDAVTACNFAAFNGHPQPDLGPDLPLASASSDMIR